MSGVAVAVVGGLVAMLGWGAADFLAKVVIDEIGELQTLVGGHLVGTVILGVCWWAAASSGESTTVGLDAPVLAAVAVAGIGQAVVYCLLYRGFAVGQVSVLSPTFASFSGIVALVSIVFLGERSGVWQIAALVVVFGGVLLLSVAPSPAGRGPTGWFGAPGFATVLAAALLAAGWTLGWSTVVADRQPLFLVFVMYAVMTVALAGFAAARGELRTPRRLRTAGVVRLVGIGLGEAAAYVALSWAYSRSSAVAVIALVSGAFALPTVLLAAVFLRERLSRYAVAGVVAVVVGTGALALV